MVIDNKAGGSGNVAYGAVARAKADGYNLLISYSAYHVGNPALTPSLPNVPTVAEAGMPDFKLEAWVGLFAPAATPPAVVAKLTADVKKALDMPETRQRADAAGIELRYLPPDALGELVKTETAYWAKTIKAAGIKAD